MKTEGEVWRSNPVPAWLGDGSSNEPDADELERERVEAELMAYAHRAAQSSGALHFAEEWERREQAEASQFDAEQRAARIWGDTGPYAELLGREVAAASSSDAMVTPPVSPPQPVNDVPMYGPIRVPGPAPEPEDVPTSVIQPGEAVAALRSILASKEAGPREPAAAAAPELALVPEPAPVRGSGPIPEPVATPPDGVLAPPPAVAIPIGPVLAETEERITEPAIHGLDLHQPVVVRHPHIPRPPMEEPVPEPTSRRERRRARKARPEPPDPDPTSSIMEAQFAQMSAAGRRLYGLDPLPSTHGR